MPNSPKVGQTTLGMPVVTCPACQETYQPSIWHHTCPPVPVSEALPEPAHVQIGLADAEKRWESERTDTDHAALWLAEERQRLADRLDAREREIEERLAERVLATSSLDPNDGDTESADPADWIVAAVRRALARQEDALTALVEHAQCERETMRAERDAWWEFARHQQFCSVCAESVESCEHGAHLMHAAEALLSSLPVESSSRGSADHA